MWGPWPSGFTMSVQVDCTWVVLLLAWLEAEEDEGFNPFEKNRLEDLLKDHKPGSHVRALSIR